MMIKGTSRGVLGWRKIGFALCLVVPSLCFANEAAGPVKDASLVFVGSRQSVRLRSPGHCSYDPTHGYYYCSNHCGADYEFYFCSPRSFGCCHIGVGYCDYLGFLRCHR